ncbi:putative protein kinase [Paratrimastix pyriformis]|uniref:Protein kinase domain-containing protein n=1 Tax=Paratrimastix pyriformis TaxID=342808 RepID=A0ABQ8UVR4_9EUKA|nr:putative protein kinase [Paratrimastix pyriformis]
MAEPLVVTATFHPLVVTATFHPLVVTATFHPWSGGWRVCLVVASVPLVSSPRRPCLDLVLTRFPCPHPPPPPRAGYGSKLFMSTFNGNFLMVTSCAANAPYQTVPFCDQAGALFDSFYLGYARAPTVFGDTRRHVWALSDSGQVQFATGSTWGQLGVEPTEYNPLTRPWYEASEGWFGTQMDYFSGGFGFAYLRNFPYGKLVGQRLVVEPCSPDEACREASFARQVVGHIAANSSFLAAVCNATTTSGPEPLHLMARLMAPDHRGTAGLVMACHRASQLTYLIANCATSQYNVSSYCRAYARSAVAGLKTWLGVIYTTQGTVATYHLGAPDGLPTLVDLPDANLTVPHLRDTPWYALRQQWTPHGIYRAKAGMAGVKLQYFVQTVQAPDGEAITIAADRPLAEGCPAEAPPVEPMFPAIPEPTPSSQAPLNLALILGPAVGGGCLLVAGLVTGLLLYRRQAIRRRRAKSDIDAGLLSHMMENELSHGSGTGTTASGSSRSRTRGTRTRTRGAFLSGDGTPLSEESMIVELSSTLPPDSSWLIDPAKLKVVSLIGKGSFGEVFRAEYNRSSVAVKRFALRTEVCESISREVEVLSKLHHPNVVTLYGVCLHAPYIDMVMELCRLGSFFDLLHSDAELSLKERLTMSLDAARGMCYLHSMNVIHRDLKSHNLLVTQNREVKVTDFGTARMMESAGTAPATNFGTMVRLPAWSPRIACCLGIAPEMLSWSWLTADPQKNTLVGTPLWSAPEILAGEKQYTEKIDCYSFGIVLFEATTRQAPYEGIPTIRVMSQVLRGLRPELPAHTPPALAQLIRDCWAHNPIERPRSAPGAPHLVPPIQAPPRRLGCSPAAWWSLTPPGWSFASPPPGPTPSSPAPSAVATPSVGSGHATSASLHLTPPSPLSEPLIDGGGSEDLAGPAPPARSGYLMGRAAPAPPPVQSTADQRPSLLPPPRPSPGLRISALRRAAAAAAAAGQGSSNSSPLLGGTSSPPPQPR